MSNTSPLQAHDHLKRQESLEAAFAFFNETSSQLARSYSALEKKVHELSEELDQSEAELAAENQKKSELEHRMQALLDFLPGGVIVLNARGLVIESNPAADKLLGSRLEGRVWRHIIAECFSPKNDDGLEVSTKTGRRLSISTSSLGIEGQIILLTDQTETRKLQDHLSRNERLSAMGKMVSALAHQIRTPLSAAILYAGHLCNSELDEATRNRFSQKCLGRLKHMEKQVRDMMLFVKSELPLNDEISVLELEAELKAAAEVELLAERLNCIWINTADGERIKCHRAALVSSIVNLINNAIQSTESALEIRVSFQVVKMHSLNYLEVCVSDNGKGMNAITLERVQEIFTTTKSQGTGLGLAVVRSVAKAHGAEFILNSIEHEGTCARLMIPLANMTYPVAAVKHSY